MAKKQHRLYCDHSDFSKFKKACEGFIKRYRLNNWTVEYRMVESEDALACIWIDSDDETADIELTKNWKDTRDVMSDIRLEQKYVTDERLVDEAHHEVLHLLLAPLAEMAERYGADPKEIKIAEHQIINKILREG